MIKLTVRDRIELDRVLDSIQGRLNEKLVRITMDLALKTNWSQKTERELYKKNIDRIPAKSIGGVLIGSHIGQIYQISLDIAKKIERTPLTQLQKNILREFIFFLVLLRTENENHA